MIFGMIQQLEQRRMTKLKMLIKVPRFSHQTMSQYLHFNLATKLNHLQPRKIQLLDAMVAPHYMIFCWNVQQTYCPLLEHQMHGGQSNPLTLHRYGVSLRIIGYPLKITVSFQQIWTNFYDFEDLFWNFVNHCHRILLLTRQRKD